MHEMVRMPWKWRGNVCANRLSMISLDNPAFLIDIARDVISSI